MLLRLPLKFSFRRERAGFRPRHAGTEIRDLGRELRRFQWRLGICGAVVFLFFFFLTLRFSYLQVVEHDYYMALAEQNRVSVVPVVPNRGLILDRNGVILAHNYSAYTLEVAQSEIRNLDAIMAELSEIIEITPRDRKRVKKLLEDRNDLDAIPLRTRLSDEEVARFAINRHRFPNVEINARLFRRYPNGDLASHVIGYMGRVSDKDKARLEQENDAANYRGTDFIGKVGLEGHYEKQLHGITGFEQVETDAGNRPVRTLRRSVPTSGNNLHLALDVRLQQIAERAFGKRRGALIAIEPATGGVLAFVSKPNFDPNLFVEGIDAANWDVLNTSLDKPLNNRALNGVYPPGSTFKPFMALAGLALGKRSPEYTIADPGWFSLGGSHRWRDWKAGGHGMVNLHRSIVISCDTYYYGLANDLGIDNLHNFIGQFGFGKATGIDLTGESRGLLPSTEWKMKRFNQRWFPGDTISVGIGQGYNLATPMQLAFGTAILANGGVVFRPHLVREIEDSQTNQRQGVEVEPIANIGLNPEHVVRVRDAMVDVNKPGGTASVAFSGAKYVTAGKTGTAQVIGMKQGEKYDENKIDERFRDHALYIAFAPADAPKIAVGILVENGGHGGSAAAPIARAVFDYYVGGVEPLMPKDATPDEEPQGD